MKWKIIKQFSSRNTLGFTFQDVLGEFPEMNRVYLGRVLANMVRKGMLLKITRDIYHIIPFNADPETYMPDRHQFAKYIMKNKAYYIGYASALEIHGLKMYGLKTNGLKTNGLKTQDVANGQAKNKEFVVTEKQMKPALRHFGDIDYHFIQHDSSRFFGHVSMWINQLEQAMVSDVEKTIVDIATKPQYSGGVIEVGNAIFRAKERIDHDKLFYYFARNNNKSAKKRFLFLTEILGLEWTNEHERLMKELGSGYSLLDPAQAAQGIRMKKFGLRINMDPIRIREKVLQSKIP